MTDILERNIINDAIEQDRVSNLGKPSSKNNEHLQNVVDYINKCGVSFSVWEKRNPDGKTSGVHGWTSMVGNEKKKVLQNLPDMFSQFLPPEYCETTTRLWKVMVYIKALKPMYMYLMK